jgi:hypothetical protein
VATGGEGEDEEGEGPRGGGGIVDRPRTTPPP